MDREASASGRFIIDNTKNGRTAPHFQQDLISGPYEVDNGPFACFRA